MPSPMIRSASSIRFSDMSPQLPSLGALFAKPSGPGIIDEPPTALCPRVVEEPAAIKSEIGDTQTPAAAVDDDADCGDEWALLEKIAIATEVHGLCACNEEAVTSLDVLQLGQNLINLIGARRCLDIGTFTGSSATAWALALPDLGHVLSVDINQAAFNRIGRPMLDRRPDLLAKLEFRQAPAIHVLDSLLACGGCGEWDFVFLDADKKSYPAYYERCIRLLRPGGVILTDLALQQHRFSRRDPLPEYCCHSSTSSNNSATVPATDENDNELFDPLELVDLTLRKQLRCLGHGVYRVV